MYQLKYILHLDDLKVSDLQAMTEWLSGTALVWKTRKFVIKSYLR